LAGIGTRQRSALLRAFRCSDHAACAFKPVLALLA